MPSPIDAVLHTPLWVWPLLALMLWLGWSGRRPHTVHPARLAILPLVGLGSSVAGLVQSPMPALAGLGWCLGLVLALPLGYAIGGRREVRRQDDGRLAIAGGWFLLGFGLSIFAARYALGVLFGAQPSLLAVPLWIGLSGAVGGLIAGIGIGWLAGLLVRPLRPLQSAALGLLIVVGGFASVVAFDSPAPLPPLAAGDTLPGIDRWDFAEIPVIRRVAARDGAPLAYRLYPGRADRAVVLVHGSSGTNISMHKSAQALQAAGATVYAISLRGHGGSGMTNGDTSYLSQLEDDLADFTKAVGLADASIHRTLIGFSSGGGFVLRISSGAQRALFDAYLAVSPYVAQDSPAVRTNSGGWVSVAVPRVVALSLLDAAGLPWFQDLPVVRFATAAAPSDNRTPVYSFRLAAGMQLPRDWRARLAGIDRPTAVILGAGDELFFADRFAPLFKELNPRIAVSLQPGLGHMDMIADPRGTAAVATEWRRLAGVEIERFDMKVREDMFAGLDGDKPAFDRAMALIGRALAANPNHAEALAWRGAGRLFLAGQAFARGSFAEGMISQSQGLADLERGVALKPAAATRGARGPVLMAYAASMRPFDRAAADRLTSLAIGDFEFIVEQEQPRWDKLAVHNRGELLGALADGWLQLGEGAKATPFLDRIVAELPNTPYAKAAAQRRADPTAKAPVTCLGCH